MLVGARNAIEWRQLALVLLMPIILSSIGVATYAATTQMPINETLTIAPHSYITYNRSMLANRTISIQLSVIEGLPPSTGEEVLLRVMDPTNFQLWNSSKDTFHCLFYLGALTNTSLPWNVPADGSYYFVIDNPNPANVTVGVKINWTLEGLPTVQAVLALSSVVIGFAAIEYVERPLPMEPQIVELRGDLDMIPDVITRAPHGLHYIIITEPSDIRCAICKTHLEPDDEVLRCPHCGSSSHTDHFLNWVRTKGYCPACGERLKERDLQRRRQM